MVTKVVNVISRGSSLCRATYFVAKRRERSSVLEGPTQKNEQPSRAAITFNDSDLRGSSGPHHDSLVISLMIGSCQVKRILVDIGSSSNILTLEALHPMGMS